ncbi:MAG TPA: maleylacetoacetate isomerase [Caulobacteraceae bacterium]|jgi:maleylpyruvate isomerase
MLQLHSYWRSTAAYRVRIGLELKGLDYGQTTHDLRTGGQKTPAYLALNPQAVIPALEADGAALTQSVAILEWLEETHPQPPLLPKAPLERARVRAMAALVACDIHPLNNLRVLGRLRAQFAADEDAIKAWIAAWIGEGFAALETQLDGGPWCFGEAPTLADCCLVPQVYSAQRFEVALDAYPRIRRVADSAGAHPAFQEAAPERQPDAP